MFKMLATSYPRGTERIHYLAIIGEGRLSELRYLNVNVVITIEKIYTSRNAILFIQLSDSSKVRDHVEVPSVPRPYFILESVEPSLETLFKSNRNKSLPLHVSVFAAIGCVKVSDTECDYVTAINYSIDRSTGEANIDRELRSLKEDR